MARFEMVSMTTMENLIARCVRLFKFSIHSIYEFNIWSKSMIRESVTYIYIYISFQNDIVLPCLPGCLKFAFPSNVDVDVATPQC
jgi:hypothetical protein